VREFRSTADLSFLLDATTMRKVKVLFFAADPLSAPPHGGVPRLWLDEDVRQMREKVRGAKYRDALELDFRWAARTDDLLQALNETRPQVVHFSGHGGNDGLVLVSSDGQRPHPVGAAALAQLFDVFRGDIHVAVLNACFSLPQAEAIAGAVGCAIGTRGEISDGAAITFGASFYRAIAFGESVKTAYDQARAALALEHFADQECPQLVVRRGVDPEKLILVSPEGVRASRRGIGRAGRTIAGLAVAGATALVSVTLVDRANRSREPLSTETRKVDAPPTLADTSSSTPTTARAAELAVPRPDDRGRQRPVAPQQVDGGNKPVEALQGTVSAPTVRPALEPESSLPVFDDTVPNRTVPPAFPP
jgi:hypothetical protein